MNYIKILGVAAIAGVALMAFMGASSVKTKPELALR